MVTTIFKDCYSVGKLSADKSRPPPMVVKLAVPLYIRLSILRSKAVGFDVPPESDQHLGTKKSTMVETLTNDAFKLLRSLASDSKVAKVWTIDRRSGEYPGREYPGGSTQEWNMWQ
jgi:hypothetical protein